MKTPSAELKRRAREILTGNYTVPVASGFLITAISTMLLMPFYINTIAADSSSQNGIYYLASLIITLIEIIFSCGLLRLHLNMARKTSYQFGDIFYGFRNRPQKIAGIYLLLALRMIPPVLPGVLLLILSFAVFTRSLPFMGISILIFLAGMIWLVRISLQYALIFFLFVENPDAGMGELFRKSKELMKGNKLRLLYLHLSFLGFSLLGVMSFGIGRLWITPYITQTCACFFLDILDEQTVVVDA